MNATLYPSTLMLLPPKEHHNSTIIGAAASICRCYPPFHQNLYQFNILVGPWIVLRKCATPYPGSRPNVQLPDSRCKTDAKERYSTLHHSLRMIRLFRPQQRPSLQLTNLPKMAEAAKHIILGLMASCHLVMYAVQADGTVFMIMKIMIGCN